MMRRSWAIVLMLAGTSGAWAAEPQQAGTQPPTAQPKSAADHATVENDPTRSGSAAMAGKRGITWPGMTRAGSVLLPNGWSLKPAGRQSSWAICRSRSRCTRAEPILAILHAGYGEHEVVTVDATTGRVIGRVALPADLRRPDLVGRRQAALRRRRVRRPDLPLRPRRRPAVEEGRLRISRPQAVPGGANPREGEPAKKYQRVPAGLALTKDGKTLYVAAAFGHSLGRFDAESGAFQAEIPLEADSYPYGLALDESRERLYVSLWSKAEVAVVNTDDVPGRRPLDDRGASQRDAAGARGQDPVRRQRQPQHGHGDRHRSGQVDRDDRHGHRPQGPRRAARPTRWRSRPTSRCSSWPTPTPTTWPSSTSRTPAAAPRSASSRPAGIRPRSGSRATARRSTWPTARGRARRANRDGPRPGFARRPEPDPRVHRRALPGHAVDHPDARATADGHIFADGLRVQPAAAGRPDGRDAARPRAPGIRSPPGSATRRRSRYVVYVIKENRTYDQVFGDMHEGNGEPNLCLFPEAVTPNHHALAREFVLLDNFYVDSEVSADGHEWSMGAYATDFVERIWPLGYRGDRRVPYPVGGEHRSSRPAGRRLPLGQGRREGGQLPQLRRVRRQRHDAGRARPRPSVKALEGHFDPDVPRLRHGLSRRQAHRPLPRGAGRLREGRRDAAAGDPPAAQRPHLGDVARASGPSTACVGDNDLALGRVVEGLSKSRFWKQMAIFVVEDDAQNGSDHVDAHRTVALAISPYIKRHSVDSTMYSTSSMLRTMELILGLEPMSQFDAAARPMFDSFTNQPDFTPVRPSPGPGRPQRPEHSATRRWPRSRSASTSRSRTAPTTCSSTRSSGRPSRGQDAVMPPPVRAGVRDAEVIGREPLRPTAEIVLGIRAGRVS